MSPFLRVGIMCVLKAITMENLQYFVFDKTGNKILEAGILPVENGDTIESAVEYAKNAFKNNDTFDDTQLLLSIGNKVLFNSLNA